MRERPLTGAVALVTGAAGGIGAAAARRLAQEGAAVGIVGSRRRRLDKLAEDISSAGGVAFAIEADVTDPERAANSVQITLDRFDRLDTLVNAEGILLLGTALHAAVADWDRMTDWNIRALLHVTHAAVPYLIDAAATSRRGVSDIVNVGATAGAEALPNTSVYSLTQFGVRGFTESLRQDLLEEGVRVSLVAPDVGVAHSVDDLGDITPIAGHGCDDTVTRPRPDEVADAIAYIVTRERGVAISALVVRSAEPTG